MATRLYHRADLATGITTTLERGNDGAMVLTRAQDTVPILEANKRAASSFDPTAIRQRTRTGIVRVASIPKIIWQRLWDMGIAQDDKAFYRWLDQPENRLFRCDDGRRL